MPQVTRRGQHSPRKCQPHRELPHPFPQSEASSHSFFLRLNKSEQSTEDVSCPATKTAAPAQLCHLQLPAPSCSSTYRGSHESRRASRTGVPLVKENSFIDTEALSSFSFVTVFSLLQPPPAVLEWRNVLLGGGKTPSWAQPLTGCGPA